MKPFNIFTSLVGLFFIVAGIDALFKNLETPIIGFIAGFSFLFLAFLNEKNDGNMKGPYISFAMSTVFFMTLAMALIQGKVSISFRYEVTREVYLSLDPYGFWLRFTIIFLLAAGALCYGIWQLKKVK